MNPYFKTIPQFSFGTGDKDNTVLITAGMDGDEYASIEATYKIANFLSKSQLKGKVNVLPIVNINGFNAVSSINPLDSKYPKHIYPGKESGTDTEQLMYYLNREYISKCSIWIDLHGGAITEYLTPYFYAFETKKGDNCFNKKVIEALNAEKAVYGPVGWWNKTETLGNIGVDYFLLEAGYSGKRDSTFISKHIEWVKTILAIKGIIDFQYKLKTEKRIYRDAYEYTPNISGLWFPKINKNLMVEKDQVIGEIRSLTNETIEIVKSPYKGEIMWITKGMLCDKGSPLFEIGINPMN